ncbi:MAG: superoxide dismutase [Candidatus Aminicenantes bacterium]|nr:superoxide dismutase [Candidatus Aminicenantes bacterium]
MKKTFLIVLCLVFLFSLKISVFSHCEIPCGIYNDEMRFELIMEHIQTIEKAIHEITHLSESRWKVYKLSESPDPVNFNQMVRWITNKEKHAEEIQHIISQYFLTQRIKLNQDSGGLDSEKYTHQLALCHQILIYAMKCKQSLDLSYVEELKKSAAEFKKSYFKKQK